MDGKPKSRYTIRDEAASGFLAGVGLALTVVAISLTTPRTARWFEHGPGRPVPTLIVGVVVFVAAVSWTIVSRNLLATALIVLNTPVIVAAQVIRFVEPDPTWARPLRTLGLGLVIAVSLVASFVYARHKRELEQRLFLDATSFAFFATIVAASVYGILDAAFDVPRLSFLWVVVFAQLVWVVALSVLERRYA